MVFERAKHETFIDIHPTSGVPLASLTRIQLNAIINRDNDIEMMSRFSTGDRLILPFLWTEEGYKEPSDDLAEVTKLKTASSIFATVYQAIRVEESMREENTTYQLKWFAIHRMASKERMMMMKL